MQLQGPEAHAVLSLQHLPKAQRCFAPLGILSCSDLCAGLMHKLAPTLDPHQALLLEQTRVRSQSPAWLGTIMLAEVLNERHG